MKHRGYIAKRHVKSALRKLKLLIRAHEFPGNPLAGYVPTEALIEALDELYEKCRVKRPALLDSPVPPALWPLGMLPGSPLLQPLIVADPMPQPQPGLPPQTSDPPPPLIGDPLPQSQPVLRPQTSDPPPPLIGDPLPQSQPVLRPQTSDPPPPLIGDPPGGGGTCVCGNASIMCGEDGECAPPGATERPPNT